MGYEKQIVELCTKLCHSKEEKIIFEDSLKHNINWDRLISCLLHHRLLLIFYYHLKCDNICYIVPKEYLNLMRIKYNSNVIRIFEYIKNIGEIVYEFDRNNIPYVITKGFYFLSNIYKNYDINIREFGDVDFLISENCLTLVKQILENKGFVQGKYMENIKKIHEASRRDLIEKRLNSHEIYPFVKVFNWISQLNAIDTVIVDINFTIFEGGVNKSPIPTQYMLDKRKKSTIDNILYFSSLSDEHNFINICYHIYMDTLYDSKKKNLNDFLLVKFVDLKLFLDAKSEHLDWNYICDNLTSDKINDSIVFSLYIIKKLYGNKYDGLNAKYFNLEPKKEIREKADRYLSSIYD